MRSPSALPLQFLALLLADRVNRQQQALIDYLRAENRVLREQLGPRRLRSTDRQHRSLAKAGKALGTSVLPEVGGIVAPETILAWYRRLVARKYDGTQRRRRAPGRPRMPSEIADLACKVATENRGFGYTRIRDTPFLLGHDLGRTTVQRVLAANGIVPAPERPRRTTRRDTLAAHRDGLAAAGFFTVEVLTWRGLVCCHVLFALQLATRRVPLAGLTSDPSAEWMPQPGRNLANAIDGFLRGSRLLILDRDPLYTSAFRQLLEGSGMQVVRLPRDSPNLNGYRERWVRSVRTECLDHLVLLGEGHLSPGPRALRP